VKRPLLLLGLGAALLALAIPVALLGRSVLSAPDRADAARTPAGGQQARSSFDQAADWVLGVRSSDPFFRVVRAYRKATADTSEPLDSGTPVRLAALARGIRSAAERSQAHVMVGTVFSLPAGNGSMSFARMRLIGGSRLLAQAVAEFRRAVLLDDRNEAAKYDLELVLSSETPEFAALSKRRLTAPNRPTARKQRAGQDAKNPRNRRRLKQGGSSGQGSGY
jgi:hypothetical protein